MVINTILGQRFLNRFLFSLKKINEKDKENDLGILLTLPQGGFLSFFLALYRKKGTFVALTPKSNIHIKAWVLRYKTVRFI